MTTPWTIPADLWAGETVAILGAGPSLTEAAVAAVRQHPSIAVNDALLLAPHAAMLVALDGNWPQAYRDFAGLRVAGVVDDELDAYYIGPSYERIEVAPGHTVELRNSGLTALRLAAAGGAARVILVGFDPETSAHFNALEGADQPYPHLAAGLAAIIAELNARGIVVERITESAVNLRSADDPAATSAAKPRSRMVAPTK